WIVDETAVLLKVGVDMINGACFVYNLRCISEKRLIVVESVGERLVLQMQWLGAVLLCAADTVLFRAVCVREGLGFYIVV
ncbi:aldehyde dehydrogenase EutE, partial [Salmonella enterica subsp. enterica serovar Infantis]